MRWKILLIIVFVGIIFFYFFLSNTVYFGDKISGKVLFTAFSDYPYEPFNISKECDLIFTTERTEVKCPEFWYRRIGNVSYLCKNSICYSRMNDVKYFFDVLDTALRLHRNNAGCEEINVSHLKYESYISEPKSKICLENNKIKVNFNGIIPGEPLSVTITGNFTIVPGGTINFTKEKFYLLNETKIKNIKVDLKKNTIAIETDKPHIKPEKVTLNSEMPVTVVGAEYNKEIPENKFENCRNTNGLIVCEGNKNTLLNVLDNYLDSAFLNVFIYSSPYVFSNSKKVTSDELIRTNLTFEWRTDSTLIKSSKRIEGDIITVKTKKYLQDIGRKVIEKYDKLEKCRKLNDFEIRCDPHEKFNTDQIKILTTKRIYYNYNW